MIEIEESDGVRVVTLNRPEKANSLTSEMLEALIDAFSISSDVNAIVLTGRGDVFSAGADLNEARAGLATSDVWERLSSAVAASPCFTVAALNGTLAGGAFGMALACDVRLAVPNAKFFYPVMKLGFLPQPSDPPRLRKLVGPSRAKMILMAGQKIGADEALSWGLVDRVVDKDALLETARGLCADVVLAEPAHVAAIKSLVDT